MIYYLNQGKLTKSNQFYRNVKSTALSYVITSSFTQGKKLPSAIYFYHARSNFILIAALPIKLQCTSIKKNYLILWHHLVETTFNKVSAGQLLGLHG